MSSLKRRLKRWGQLKQSFTLHPSNPHGSVEPPAEQHTSHNAGVVAAASAGTVAPSAGPMADIPDPNLNPMRRAIWRLGRKPKIVYMVRRVKRFFDRPPFRPLNAEEERLKAEAEYRRELSKQLIEEAKITVRRIQDALARRNICHKYSRSGMPLLQSLFTPKIDYVKFDTINVTPDAFYLHVDAIRLPYGVRLESLWNPDLLSDLSHSVGMEITSDADDFGAGVWYVIARSSGVRAIPRHVKLAEMMTAFPKSADALSFPLGMGQNGKKYYRSLRNMYSILVGGTIGGGKSNLLNVILCSLIRRNPPEALEILMIDLKGGLEFSFYEGIPHLKTHIVNTYFDKEGNENEHEITRTGIIEHRNDVPPLLEWLINEGEKRNKIIKEGGHKNIGNFNRMKKAHNRLPHILLVIDEWADVSLDKTISTKANDMLANIAQRFRAVGIHVIACTQVPNKQAIQPRIKGVLPAVCAFSVPDVISSMAILGTGDARGLAPEGRFVFKWKREQVAIQAPYISDEYVKATVKGAISGEYEEIQTSHDVTPEEIYIWAIDHTQGRLSRDRIFDEYGSRGITKAEIETLLKEIQDTEIMVEGAAYTVEPARGNQPRRLVAVTTDKEPE